MAAKDKANQTPASRAFLSSTGKDLGEYRRAAIAVCNRFGIVPIAMEFFEAMGAGATQGSIEKLNDADVYIGVLAHRYGYVEPGYARSVTELEFAHAGERGIERLCFLVDPGYPWPPDSIDYENRAALSTFKSLVETSSIRQIFTTVDDFVAKLTHTLAEWRERHRPNTCSPAGTSPSQTSVVAKPPTEPRLIGRDADITTVAKLLRNSISNRSQFVAVRGWPGVGKTTLVSAIAWNAQIRKTFPDGILWAALGEHGFGASVLTAWASQLRSHLAESQTLEQSIISLRNALSRRRLLIVLDDVWRSDDAAIFKQIVGRYSSVLMTTRSLSAATELALPEQIHTLPILEPAAAMELFCAVAPETFGEHREEVGRLLNDLEYLPLAIRVAGRLLETSRSQALNVHSMFQQLRETHKLLDAKAPEDRFDPKTGTTPTIAALLRRSTDQLSEGLRRRFAILGAFAPKPATFELDAIKFVWEDPDPLPAIGELVDRGLLEFTPSDGLFQMHALLVMHARSIPIPGELTLG